MGIHTLSLDDELMEKLDENTASRKKSQKVEELIQEWLDEDPDVKTDMNIVENSSLTDVQKDVVYSMIKNGKTEMNGAQWANFIEKYYDKNTLKNKCHMKITGDPNIPYSSDGDKSLSSRKIECECGANIHVGPLSKNAGECPKCGRVIVKGLKN